MGIVRLWHRQGRTVVVVLHDLDLIRAEFPQTLLLNGAAPDTGTLRGESLASGARGWGPTRDVLTDPAVRHARLRAAMPSLSTMTAVTTGGAAEAAGSAIRLPPAISGLDASTEEAA